MKFLSTLLLLTAIFSFLSCSKKNNSDLKKLRAGHYQAIDTITSVLLETVSGKAGEVRDWKRFKNLFKPYAQLTAVSHNQNTINTVYFSIDEFINLADRNSHNYLFYEVELNKEIKVFGHIAHVFQVYVSKSGKKKSSHRGVNSFQLVFDGGRWWIVSITWDIETPENRIPSEFLGSDKREILPS